LIDWCREAFDLPVLSLEVIDAQLAGRSTPAQTDKRKQLSLRDVRAVLSSETDNIPS
jgi:hypothetical protein